MRIESVTNVGLYRENNEDRYLVNVLDEERALLVIADGMGGHAAGEIAAELAVSCFEGCRPTGADICAQLRARMQKAQHSVVERARIDSACRGMGTTLTAVMLAGEAAFWAHVGDTRIYLYQEGALHRMTEDHTMAGMLLKKGEITTEEARVHPYANVLTRCIGCERYEPDSGVFYPGEGDFVLLSSDGLHDLISDSRIADFLSTEADLAEKLAQMVSACLKAGGRDNITALIAAL